MSPLDALAICVESSEPGIVAREANPERAFPNPCAALKAASPTCRVKERLSV